MFTGAELQVADIKLDNQLKFASLNPILFSGILTVHATLKAKYTRGIYNREAESSGGRRRRRRRRRETHGGEVCPSVAGYWLRVLALRRRGQSSATAFSQTLESPCSFSVACGC